MRAQPSSFQDIPGAPGMGLWVPLSPSVTFAPLPSILDGERRSKTFPASCAQHQEPNAAQSQPPTAPIPVIHREKEPPEPAQQTPGFGTPQTHNSIPRTRVEVTCQDQRSRTSVPRLWVKNGIFFLCFKTNTTNPTDLIPCSLTLLLIPQSQDKINEPHTELLEGSALLKPQKHLQQQN